VEDVFFEKILYGEFKVGLIVLVDVEGEGKECVFIFCGMFKVFVLELVAVVVVALGALFEGGEVLVV